MWNYLFNSSNVEWVFVRDHKTDLVYYGWIEVFSDSEKERELILKDVDVYSNTTDLQDPIYKIPLMYLSRDKHDLTIEVPKLKSSNKNKKEKNNHAK